MSHSDERSIMKTTNLEKLEKLLPRKGYISVDRRGYIHIRGVKREWLDEQVTCKKGHWIPWQKDGKYGASCSECGRDANYYITPVGIPVWSRDPYCPKCGIEMEEEEND